MTQSINNREQELLEALSMAQEELSTIINILDGRMDSKFRQTDLGMRLSGWFNQNAFLDDRIEKIIKK